jgi:ubiquinone/menaquinone biosynthesis C-methylase UbiE
MAGAQADIHTKILTASTTEELMGIYDNWAQGYETQLLDEWGYTSPQTAVKLLASAMQLDGVHVLDAGCGTGLVGLALNEAGIVHLSGIDYSPGMLAEARQKGVYQALDCMDMNQPLAIAADVYDAVTCIGTFTSTHVAPEALSELIRVTRSGGTCCVYCARRLLGCHRVCQLGGRTSHVGQGGHRANTPRALHSFGGF